jgi:3-hydroxyacyl-CoA dehydrogenase
VGPQQAHDEATIALALQASITQVADEVMTDRLPIGEVRDALETLDVAGIRGRRHGAGFYVYDQEGHRIGPNDQFLLNLGVTPSSIHPETVAERLLLAFASECFLCWDEGILCHPSDGDVASVLAIGFPRHLGGPFNWADEVGIGSVIERLGTLGSTEFPSGSTLRQLDDLNERFSDQTRRATPTPATSGDREQL